MRLDGATGRAARLLSLAAGPHPKEPGFELRREVIVHIRREGGLGNVILRRSICLNAAARTASTHSVKIRTVIVSGSAVERPAGGRYNAGFFGAAT